MTLMQKFTGTHSHQRLRDLSNLLFADPYPVPFPHLLLFFFCFIIIIIIISLFVFIYYFLYENVF